MTLQGTFRFMRTAPAPDVRRRNLVIEAGAGTGKTTAIVAEVLNRLLSDAGTSPERIALVTFTEKAAGEIADRIHAAIVEVEAALESGEHVQWPARSDHPLFEVPEAMRETVRAACSAQLARIHLLRSQTIHSFCQSLLRQYPIEAGLDPQFKIIEGFERSLLHGQLYDAWLDHETRTGASAESLRELELLLGHAGYLFMVRDMIFNLVERRDLLGASPDETGDLGDVSLVTDLVTRCLNLVPPPGVGTRKISRGTNPDSLQRYVMHSCGSSEWDIHQWIEYLAPIANVIRTVDLREVTGDLKEALNGLRTGGSGKSIYDRLVAHRGAVALHSLTRRFVEWLDREKRKLGVVDFDDLLLRTLALLDNPTVLERVRSQFDTIFVDEFQDTDRTQAKIIDRIARDASGEYVDGKLVIVGDPKQSIYGFRRADPETYDAMTRSLREAGAEWRLLSDHYRSDAPLLEAINAMFTNLMPRSAPGADPNVFRPPYEHLNACKGSNDRELDARVTLLHTAEVNENERIAEAEAMAAWIEKHRDGGEGDLKRFAILFRRLTELDDYLDVFERHGIDYVLAPARVFLDRRAPVDLLAVLRAVAWPFDRGAQISAARSPYFALTDEEIARGILAPAPGDAWELFGTAIEQLRLIAGQTTITGLIDAIVGRSSIEEVYAQTSDGVRSQRHLDHLRSIAFEYDAKVGGSVRQFVGEIDRRRAEPDEMEPLLADETRNAIRILTVHAAKGLEFETVILPDLTFAGSPEGTTIFTTEEPKSLVLCQPDSLSAHFRNDAHDFLKRVATRRAIAESQRLFYVAVTRARSDVVFVLPPTAQKGRESSFLGHLQPALGIDLKALSPRPGRELFPTLVGAVAGELLPPIDAAARQRRRLRNQELEATLLGGPLTPVSIDTAPAPVALTRSVVAARRGGARKRESGIVIHRALELWDGSEPFERAIEHALRETAPGEATAARVRETAARVKSSPILQRLLRATTVAREMPLYVGIGEELQTRRIDRLIREESGLAVVDYKSGTRKEDDREQVAAYCDAVRSLTGEPCRGLIWYLEEDALVEL